MTEKLPKIFYRFSKQRSLACLRRPMCPRRMLITCWRGPYNLLCQFYETRKQHFREFQTSCSPLSGSRSPRELRRLKGLKQPHSG